MRASPASLLFCLLSLAAAGRAGAANFCVTNSVDFQQALEVAATNGTSDTIRFGAVTLIPPADGFQAELANAESLTIEGGWFSFSGNCNLRVDDPTLSVIDGGGTRRGLMIDLDDGNGTLALRNFTIRNTRVSGVGVPSQRGPALNVQYANGAIGEVLIERMVFRGNVSQDDGGAISLGGSGTIRILNNLFTGNAASSGAAMNVVGNSSVVYINNNTIAGNSATANSTQAAIKFGGSSDRVMNNNILWDNTTPAQHDVATGSVLLVNNDIERVFGDGLGGSVGTLSVDPLFADADYRLRADSPLIDAGVSWPLGGVPTLDLQGDGRVGQDAIDLGAYELPLLFIDGFE
jgi:hypothetical protein